MTMRRILCYGDSNTYGYDPRDFFGMPYKKPWPTLVTEQTGDVLINCGQNGREIPHSHYSLLWMKEDIDAHMPVDVLMIMLGSNDLLGSLKPDVDAIIERLRMMINYIRDNCQISKICIIAPPQMQIESEVHNQLAAVLAIQMEALAHELSTDYLNAYAWALELAFDGVHLTEAAHEVFAEHIVHYIQSL